MPTIRIMLGLLDTVVDAFTGFWDFCSTPLGEIAKNNKVFKEILDLYMIENITLLQFMLGAGLLIYVSVQFVIWLLNTVT